LFRFLPAFFPPSFGFTSPTSSTPLHTHAVRPWLAQVPTPPYLCALRRAAAAVWGRRPVRTWLTGSGRHPPLPTGGCPRPRRPLRRR
jgi:hypothetical protein